MNIGDVPEETGQYQILLCIEVYTELPVLQY